MRAETASFDAIRWRLAEAFSDAGCATPQLDARTLLAAAMGWRAETLIMRGRERVPFWARARLAIMRRARLKGKPVARILRRREFYGHEIYLNAASLDPRPETELLVDCARALAPPAAKILDIGTGSGCILIALAHELPQMRGLGLDISAGALRAARRNRARHGLEKRLCFRQSDWLSRLAARDGLFDLIIANPPYIPSGDITRLAREVRCFDPRVALDGGQDGFAAYRAILGELHQALRPNGLCLFEIGQGQAAEIADYMRAAGLVDITLRRDLAGIARVIYARRP